MSDDLVVSVGANIAALERQMRATVTSSERAAADIEARFNKLNPTFSTAALTSALKGFVAAFTLDKMIQGLAAANAELVRIGDTAKRVGLDVQRFQELQFAGKTNGLSGQAFGTGLEGLAEKLNEARQTENALTKLFDDNNIKLKNRKGEVIGINDALGKVAGLVQNAATEFDKIKIAEAVGLSRDWVPLLEQGAEAINRQASAARNAGAVLDSDVIQKAKDFERDWAVAVERWATVFKANAAVIIGLIDTILGKAGELFAGLDRYSKGLQAKSDLEKNGAAGASRSTIEYAQGEFRKVGESLPKELQKRAEELNDEDRERNRASRSGAAREPLNVDVRGRTNTKSLFDKGSGGGGGGKSDEEQAQDRLDRYIETLMRQNSVLDAQIATFGKSNAEKRAAVELAKAQVDLNKLDETDRAKVIESLTREITLSEQKRTQLESLKNAQQGLVDAQKFFGNAAVDALEDLIVNGAKAEDVVKRLASSLAKAALQALLIGDGPLAGLFGTKGVGGSAGGLIGSLFSGAGSLFGRATGGPVNAGQPYRVGERGPETFVPMTAGKIVPAGQGGGVSLRVINNGPPMAAQVQQRADGNLDLVLSQIESGLADRAASGRSALNNVFRRDAGVMRG